MTQEVDRLILASPSCQALLSQLAIGGSAGKLTNKSKGDVFERLTQLYLQTGPEYVTKLRHVWWHNQGEVPERIRRKLNLPSPDEGIDLVAETRDGEFWAIQSKFRSNPNDPLLRTDLGTFKELTWETCKGFSQAVVVHPINKPIRKAYLAPRTTEIGLDRWLALTDEDWQRIRGRCESKHPQPLNPREPRAHQQRAIDAARTHFAKEGQSRGRLIMPCGTGKSLTAFWIAEALKAKSILVAVPSLALIRQSLGDWTKEFLARGVIPDWLCVCSDESTGQIEQDDFLSSAYELGIPATTDPKAISAFLRRKRDGHKIIFTTYQSSARLAKAARSARHRFDLGILDEAHKTVGVKEKAFATLLFEKNIEIKQRLFMTATERLLRGRNDEVLSMDDVAIYGGGFFQLSFKEAIEQKIITDYRIITVTVSSSRLQQIIEDNRLLNIDPKNLSEAEAQSVAAGIALKSLYRKHGIRHAISFHRSIKMADLFREQQDALKLIPPKTLNLHVSSKKSVGQRAQLMKEFKEHPRALLTNARCLTEGVDIPSIDCVLFADPKQSVIDIVQAAGRALRRHKGKNLGYILLPLIVPDGMEFEEFAETTAFKQVARVVTSLSTQDERIAEEFKIRVHGRKSSGKIVEIEGDVPVGLNVSLTEFAEAIATKVWSKVARVNWRAFGEARKFAQDLGLSSVSEWQKFATSGGRPLDIPAYPNQVYGALGWKSWGDWLGTGFVSTALRQYRTFEAAREYVQQLHIKDAKEWRSFATSAARPIDIPSNPQTVYLSDGWSGWGDWLGTGAVASANRKYRSFKAAREFARQLGLSSEADWKVFRKSGRKPPDIPSNPHQVYAGKGWCGMGDWLGTDRVASNQIQYRTFGEAREFARSLKLSSETHWRAFCKSGRRPHDVPANPAKTYASKGWKGMGDWLGTGTVATFQRKYLSFGDARKFVHSLGLRTKDDWSAYCKSGNRPPDIPAAVNRIYADEGWSGWGDWLGTKFIATFNREFRPFEEARRFVHSLGLNSSKDWRVYCKSVMRPSDIPTSPNVVYAKSGWAGMGDWLGSKTVATYLRHYKAFDEARTFARSLKLSSKTEWSKFSKSGARPSDVPANPYNVYRDKGWISWSDWLGTNVVHMDRSSPLMEDSPGS